MKKIFIATALFLTTGLLTNAKTGLNPLSAKTEIKDKKDLGNGDDKKDLGNGDAKLATVDKKDLGNGDDKKDLGNGDVKLA